MTDRYIPGVPCWVDAVQPDPLAAAEFYSGLFGWDCENTMPEGEPGHYLMARIDGEDVAALGDIPPGAPPVAVWNSYVMVTDADDTAAAATAAGGEVVIEPFDIFDAGRMAMIADPQGAVVSVWQPGEHRGASKVNEHGAVNFNDLHTSDIDGAAAFYGTVFGWDLLDLGPAGRFWAMSAYGDHLERLNPGLRASMAEMGAPTGFENVVASLTECSGDTPPHWSVTFAVDDADLAAKRVGELGGRVVEAPTDAPWVRHTVLEDPQGATFVASQFVAENRVDVGG